MNKSNNQTPHEVEDAGDGNELKNAARSQKTVRKSDFVPAFEFTGCKAGVRLFILAGHWISCALAWIIRMIRVPFRYIHAGISYAIFFLIAALVLWLISWTGDGALMMKSGGELFPAIQQSPNAISIDARKMIMEFHALSSNQKELFLQLRALSCQLADGRNEFEENKDKYSEDERDAFLKAHAQISTEIFQKAKPLTGIDAQYLKNIRSIAVKPEILEVTLVIVNINQSSSQPFTFRLYNPGMDIEAAIKRAKDETTPEQYKAVWSEQNDTIRQLCSIVHEGRSYDDAYQEALKLKTDADKKAEQKLKKAQTLKNETLIQKEAENYKEITNKRVEEYFCDFVSSEQRDKLDIFIMAPNKDEQSVKAANRHDTEKVYIFVNRVPPCIIVNYDAISEEADVVAGNLLQLFAYPQDEFNFSAATISNMQMLFQNANSPHISPEMQWERLRSLRERDIIGEELDKINQQLIAAADLANKQNLIKIENGVQVMIDQRPEGMKELTEEGKKNIRNEVIKNLNIKHVKPNLRDRKSVTKEEKQTWLANAYKEAGVETVNLFYSPEVVDSMRENESLDEAETFLSGAINTCAIIILLICAGLSLLVPLATFANRVYAAVCKAKEKEVLWDLNTNLHFIKFRKIVYYVVLVGVCCFLVYWCAALYVICDIADKILAVIPEKEMFQPEEKTIIWLHYFCYWLPGVALTVIALLACFVTGTKKDFGIPPGDSKLYGILTGKTTSGSTIRIFYLTTVVLVLLLTGPYLINFQYICEIKNPFAPMQENFMNLDSYEIPGGGGGEPPPKAVVIKKKKPKKVKKFVVSQNTSHIFEIPDLNDDERLQEIDDATESQYATGSMFGKGKSKGKPGWAGGMEDGKIRFIRLQYSGGGDSWNWNMGKGSDYNMLIYLRDVGFQVASDTESVTVNKLAKGFRKGKKPPFVYLTGRGSINLSNAEVKQLNEYLLKDGGMIFADNAGGSFGHHFRAMLKRVLPNHKLVDIANDDPIYKSPYYFPNGAPAFFHHDGYRAMGIKNNGRWIVFYHPGDIGDAWKGAGLTKQQQTDAFKLGANVISYAFGAYLENLSKE